MKRTFLAIGLALVLGTSTFAKTPKEVLEPYKAYRAAIAADDNQLAAEHAYDAWQMAEDLMGNTKTTGDLASNFADLEPFDIKKRSATLDVAKAYRRSIDLSNLHGDLAADVEAQRRTDYLAWGLQFSNLKIRKKYNINALNRFLEQNDFIGTTYEGDMLSLKAQSEFFEENWMASEKHALAAMKVYDRASDGMVSYLKYVVPIYHAKSLVEMDRIVDATLVYQNLMDALETDAGHENVVSNVTYGEWLTLKERVLEDASDDPRIADILDYEVPSKRTALFSPLERTPPKFPPMFLQGNHSGYVRVKFDVDIKGRVISPVITASTNTVLEKAALESLEGWRYAPNITGDQTKNIEMTIRFNLQNEKGRLFPVQKLKVY